LSNESKNRISALVVVEVVVARGLLDAVVVVVAESQIHTSLPRLLGVLLFSFCGIRRIVLVVIRNTPTYLCTHIYRSEFRVNPRGRLTRRPAAHSSMVFL